jgi:hydrogenase maturation protease
VPEAGEPPRVAIIAVGNPLRGDDGATLVAAQHLRAYGLPVSVIGEDVLGLVDALAGADAAVLLDTVRTGAAAGTIVRVELTGEDPLEHAGATSTHALGLGEAVELARALGGLPRRVVVYGVEGARFDAGEELSPPVRAAIEPFAVAVASEVEALRAGAAQRGER